MKSIKVRLDIDYGDHQQTWIFDMDPENTDLDRASHGEHAWPSRFINLYPPDPLLRAHGHLEIRGLIKEQLEE